MPDVPFVQAQGPVGVSITRERTVTATWSGFSTTVQSTIRLIRARNVVTAFIAPFSGTSTASSLDDLDAIPEGLRPAVTTSAYAMVIDNFSVLFGRIIVDPDGRVGFNRTFVSGSGVTFTTFTASGQKGLERGLTITWQI